MSDNLPPISRTKATEYLNKAFYFIEQYVSNSILTDKERRSLSKTQDSMRDSGTKIISALPSKKNNNTFDSKLFESSRTTFSGFWERYKEKIQYLVSKDPIEMCDDILPFEHSKICGMINKIIQLDVVSQQQQIYDIKEQISDTIIHFEESMNLFLKQIHKKKADKVESKKAFLKTIKKFKQLIGNEYNPLFRVAALSGEDHLQTILHRLENMSTVTREVDSQPSAEMPKLIKRADFKIKVLLNDGQYVQSSEDEEEEQNFLIFQDDKRTKRAKSDAPLSLENAPPSMENMTAKKIKESVSFQAKKFPKIKETNSTIKLSKSQTSINSSDELLMQKKIDEIKAEIERVEAENYELQHQLNVLETNKNTAETLDSKIENYLMNKIAILDREISKEQLKRSQISSKIADEIVSCNEAIERFSQREMAAKKISEEIQKGEIFSQCEKLEKAIRDAISENESLKTKKENLENRIKEIQSKKQNIGADDDKLKEDIENLRSQLDNLQNNVEQEQESLYRSREQIEENPIIEILQQIEEERGEIIKLERCKGTLVDNDIPDLIASIKITSAELKRISKGFKEMRTEYENARRDMIKQNLNKLMFV